MIFSPLEDDIVGCCFEVFCGNRFVRAFPFRQIKLFDKSKFEVNKLKEKRKIEMSEMKCEKDIESVYAFLYKDRTPFARAYLLGDGENEDVCGSVSFYETPLGVLVRAELCGLSKKGFGKRKAYNFCVRDEKQSECRCAISGDKRSLCAIMPTAYEKEGRADCVIVTRRIKPSELVGKSIAVYEKKNGCPKDTSSALAFGNVAYT